MKRSLFSLGLLSLLPLVATAQAPASQNPPAQPAAVTKPATAPATSSAEIMRLEPTEADLKKAREEREKHAGDKAREGDFVSKRGTKIQTITDQNNHMTSVKVTPGSTEIPYTMKNQANRPIQNGPTSNAHSTLGTPTFVELKW